MHCAPHSHQRTTDCFSVVCSSGEVCLFSGGDLIAHFWAWNDLSSYLLALGTFTFVCSLITALFIQTIRHMSVYNFSGINLSMKCYILITSEPLKGSLFQWTVYIESLGMVSLLVEASLGMPQLIRNYKRRSTTGMSVRMVFLWLLGDCAKTVYFVARSSPAQFWICAILQITIDILILLQVHFYGKGPPIPYAAPQTVQ
ncbi:unnamed protein product [Toxocara canis]|uniref:PQ-loop repeat-containing protein 1 n=1 Tax=Toxocara canis TaxID=6265 RepID=A0A3P7GV80_TOXCA|nr:unnamed protein product [Toxocara canis]